MSYETETYPDQSKYANKTAKPVTATSAIEAFDGILGRLEILANRARGCADNIAGCRPSAAGEDVKKDPKPQNLITQIQDRRNRLAQITEVLESEINRLENSLS